MTWPKVRYIWMTHEGEGWGQTPGVLNALQLLWFEAKFLVMAFTRFHAPCKPSATWASAANLDLEADDFPFNIAVTSVSDTVPLNTTDLVSQ